MCALADKAWYGSAQQLPTDSESCQASCGITHHAMHGWWVTLTRSVLLPLVLQLHEGNNSLSWGLVIFTVDSEEDLSAMRRALAEQVSFFEADLAGFTTIRGYQEAASLAAQTPTDAKSAGLDIPYRVLRELPANYVSDLFESDWTASVHAEVCLIPYDSIPCGMPCGNTVHIFGQSPNGPVQTPVCVLVCRQWRLKSTHCVGNTAAACSW